MTIEEEARRGEREKLWLMLRLLGRVEAHLRSDAETGRLAERQHEH